MYPCVSVRSGVYNRSVSVWTQRMVAHDECSLCQEAEPSCRKRATETEKQTKHEELATEMDSMNRGSGRF